MNLKTRSNYGKVLEIPRITNTTIKYFVDNVTADKANKISFKEGFLCSRKMQCL